MAKLKVFRGNYDGCHYRLVATTSIPKAMALVGKPNKRLFERDFSVIEHKSDCLLALANPGTVFTKPITVAFGVKNPWTEIEK